MPCMRKQLRYTKKIKEKICFINDFFLNSKACYDYSSKNENLKNKLQFRANLIDKLQY